MKHVIKVRGGHVFGISPPCIVQGTQKVEQLEFHLDKEWEGLELYSVIFHRAHSDDVEVALDPEHPVVTIPAASIRDKGWLSFQVRGVRCDGTVMKTASKCARIEVVASGERVPYDDEDEVLTLLDQLMVESKAATDDAYQAAGDADEAADRANAAAVNADEAAERANAAADKKATDYVLLTNKPRIEEVELRGNRGLSEFGMGLTTNQDVLSLFA